MKNIFMSKCNKYWYMKHKLEHYFSNKKRHLDKKMELDLVSLFLIAVSCILYIALTYDLPSRLYVLLSILDFLVLVIFVIEFFLRMHFAEKKRDFFLNRYTYLDALAIFPYFFGIDTQYLRLLRVFRFLRFSNFYLNYAKDDFKLSTENIFIIRLVFSLSATLFVSSGLILTIEQDINPNINSFDDALYFTLVSATTVGYGDIVPLTQIGKIIIMIVIIIGVILIPYNIGTLISHITNKQHYKEVECGGCGLQLHEYDSRFCKHCGLKLKKVRYHSAL